jgi:hypothetical protein
MFNTVVSKSINVTRNRAVPLLRGRKREQISVLNTAELILLESRTWKLDIHGKSSYKGKEWRDIYEA